MSEPTDSFTFTVGKLGGSLSLCSELHRPHELIAVSQMLEWRYEFFSLLVVCATAPYNIAIDPHWRTRPSH